MNNKSELFTNVKIQFEGEGYVFLGSASTIFELDVVSKNLQLNGFEIKSYYPDLFNQQEEHPSLFVRRDKKAEAEALLNVLELHDFITTHGE